jgi:hypothetical protein
VINSFTFISLFILSHLTIFQSRDIDVEQLYTDFLFLNLSLDFLTLKFFTSINIALLTILLGVFFRPFIEVYLNYYTKWSFYILINLVSVSAVMIVLRIYGYSRLQLIIYILFSSIMMLIIDKKR